MAKLKEYHKSRLKFENRLHNNNACVHITDVGI